MTAIQVVLILAVAIAAVTCRPTHCERWRGDNQYRCAKDDYRADTVRVRSITDQRSSFKVGQWLSSCGHPGANYSDKKYDLNAGATIDLYFSEVGPGACNEMFIYDCKINGRGRDCIDVVTPSVP